MEGAVKVEICAIFEPPKSVSKKVREKMLNNEIPYTKKPDIDNMFKALTDSIIGAAYDDDACIDEIHAYKMYGPHACAQIRLTDEKHVVKPFKFSKKKEENL